MLATPLVFLLLALVSSVVGLFIGAVGIGGVLMVPALTSLGGLNVHAASATALFTFFFTGILGTILFQRHGSIEWRTTLPVCVSAVLSAYAGAVVNAMLSAASLNLIIAAIITGAGAYILLPARHAVRAFAREDSRWHLLTLLGIGAVAGFGSGLSGAGGPLFSVPIMLILGFAPLTAIGASQVLQITSSASGTMANLAHGSIDFAIAGWIVIFELAGVLLGVRTAHLVNMQQLRRGAAWLCIIVGLAIFMRSL
jgi:uncharacterized membrane protein YfcA